MKRVGAVAERRRHLSFAGQGFPEGHEGHQRLEAFRRAKRARCPRHLLFERGRLRVDIDKDQRPAGVRNRLSLGKPVRIEAGVGKDRARARRVKDRPAVDGGERGHLAAVEPVERTDNEVEPGFGVEIRAQSRVRQRRDERRLGLRAVEGMGGGRLGRDARAWRRVGPYGAAGIVIRPGPLAWIRVSHALDRANGVGSRAIAGRRHGGRGFRRLSGERSEDRAASLEPRLASREVADPVLDRIRICTPPVRLQTGQGGRFRNLACLGPGDAGDPRQLGAKSEISGAGEAEGERQRARAPQAPTRGPA